MGDIDELNCALGVLLAQKLPADTAIQTMLQSTQSLLFELGSELAVPDYHAMQQTDIDTLEIHLDLMNADLPPLKEFILPGGNPSAASCHMARAICRRAERHYLGLADDAALNPLSLAYLNRLSDWLFVLARVLVRCESGEEVLWQPRKVEA
jgi:cob(I)alamin adenosyltransferase